MDDRVILHIDMDAFFISVEPKDCPSLKGRTAAVLGVAPNKLLSRLGSRLKKTDGLITLKIGEVEEVLPTARHLKTLLPRS